MLPVDIRCHGPQISCYYLKLYKDTGEGFQFILTDQKRFQMKSGTFLPNLKRLRIHRNSKVVQRNKIQETEAQAQ